MSLSPVTPLSAGEGSGGGASSSERSGGSDDGGASGASGRETVSFEDAFDAEMREEFGDLGPGTERPSGGDRGDRGDRGGNRRGGGRRGGGRR